MTFCSKCGNAVSGKFCTKCGAPAAVLPSVNAYGSSEGYAAYDPVPRRGDTATRKSSMRIVTGIMMLLNLGIMIAVAAVIIFCSVDSINSFVLRYGYNSDVSDMMTGIMIMTAGFLLLHTMLVLCGITGSLGNGKALGALLAHVFEAVLVIVLFIVLAIIIYNTSVHSHGDIDALKFTVSFGAGAYIYLISAAVGSLFWLLGLIFSIIALSKETS